MLVYKDILTGDELASDSYPLAPFDIHTDKQGKEHDFNKCVLRFKCKYQTEKTEVSDDLIGANASAECEAEQTEASSKSGINLVLAHNLKVCPFGKKDFAKYVKARMKKVKDEKDVKQTDEEKATISEFISDIAKQFKDLQFYRGESLDEHSALVIEKWQDDTPYIYILKSDVIEEKF